MEKNKINILHKTTNVYTSNLLWEFKGERGGGNFPPLSVQQWSNLFNDANGRWEGGGQEGWAEVFHGGAPNVMCITQRIKSFE